MRLQRSFCYTRFPFEMTDLSGINSLRDWLRACEVRYLLGMFFGAALLVQGVSAFAAPDVESRHSLEEIYSEVEHFLQQELQPQQGTSIEVMPLDSRLRLKTCETPLKLSWQGKRKPTGKVVIGAQCLSAPWRLYVSVMIRSVRQVVVVQEAILQGEPVSDRQLTTEPRELSTLRQGYFESPEQVAGKYAKRAIRPGTVLHPKLLYRPELISKGDLVSIVVNKGGLQVQMKGVALHGAHRDQRIQVRNSSSGKVIEGTAVAAGRVEMAQ